jgi:hypothetical protein
MTLRPPRKGAFFGTLGTQSGNAGTGGLTMEGTTSVSRRMGGDHTHHHQPRWMQVRRAVSVVLPDIPMTFGHRALQPAKPSTCLKAG